jgi:DNA (cytosine-5)-methyltransferase 1
MDDLPWLHRFTESWARCGWRDPWELHDWSDPRTPLVLEPLRFIEQGTPEWVVMEQVPPVLPLWQQYAAALHDQGWHAWAGVLNAADFGVAQTRRRAILIAHRSRLVGPPEPTHAEHPEPSLFGANLLPWVSMADALGWGRTVGPVGAVTTRAHTGNGAGGSNQRSARDAEIARGLWALNRPATTVAGDPRPSPPCHHENGSQSARAIPLEDVRAWWESRPATTIVGTFAPDVVAAPGYRQAGDGPRQDAPGSVRITERDALILQSFPADYPVCGPKTARFLQIGNAVPPLLARRILEVVL